MLFDTGHIGYTHKLLTGRKNLFDSLNTYGGMNRFLTLKKVNMTLLRHRTQELLYLLVLV